MADETSSSTVPQRQLGRLLSQLREESLVSVDAVAHLLNCSRQKIWRMERGLVPIRLPDAAMLCDLYGLSTDMTAVVTGLARESKTKGWWQSHGDSIPHWFSLYVSLEAAACQIRRFDNDLIPGLLQTRAYMTALFRRERPDSTDAEVEKAVAVRLKRQSLLIRRLPSAPRLDVVLSEAVLRRPLPDPRAMAGQLRHLLRVTEDLFAVTVRVLPLAAGPPMGGSAGTFVLLDFAPPAGRQQPEPTTVYVEGLTGALYLDQPSEVAAYERVWRGLESLVLSEGESTEVIESMIGEFDG